MEIIIENPTTTTIADIIQRVSTDPNIISDWIGFNRAIDLAKAELNLSEDEAVKLVQNNWNFNVMHRTGLIFG